MFRPLSIRPPLALLLVSAWPLVNFANVNRDKVFSIQVLLGFFTLTAALSLLAYAVFRRLLPRLPEGSVVLAITAGHALFFGSSIVLPPLGRALATLGLEGYGAAWAVASIVILGVAAWAGSRPFVLAAVTTGLAIAVSIPAVQVSAYHLGRWRDSRLAEATTAAHGAPGSVVARPNVYFLLADGYGRTDTMKNALGFDNRPYIDELGSLGFFVAERARANYPTTFLALSSTMQMNYVATDTTPRFSDRSRFNQMLAGDNAAVRTFKGLGYAFVQVGSGLWQETGCRGHEDICLEKATFGAGEVFRLGFGETEMALMEMTPAFKRYVAAAKARGVYDGAITNFAGLTKALRTIPTEKPIFVVAHSYPPHPPFIYAADCSIRDEIIHDYGPMRDWGDDAAGRARYRQLYAESAECVSRQMVFFAREIVRRDPDAIVIIQSDHGSDTMVDWSPEIPLSRWPANAVEERFGILNAIRVPARCSQWQYDTMSPVNTFRLVLGCMQDAPPDLLPDRSFVASYENHPDFGLVHEYLSP